MANYLSAALEVADRLFSILLYCICRKVRIQVSKDLLQQICFYCSPVSDCPGLEGEVTLSKFKTFWPLTEK